MTLKDKNILIAEDSIDNQFLMNHYLKNTEANIKIVNNGREALDFVSDANTDIILMDIQMPILDGYLTMAELRKSGFNKPIIALTAHALNEEKERALEFGFTDYLTKPLDRALLLKTLERFLD